MLLVKAAAVNLLFKLLFGADLTGFLILTVGFILKPLAIKSVTELSVQTIIVRLERNRFAIGFAGLFPLLAREVFLPERGQ